MEAALLTSSTSTTPDAPASSPAAPATSAPTSEPRPQSFAEAFAKDTVPPPVEAPPATEATATEPPKGPIPFDVHKKTLDNSYRERDAAKSALETYKSQFGWAEQVPRETMQEWTGIANRMATDPIGFLSELQAQIEAHPVFGPQLKSHAARTLARGRSQSVEPAIPVVDANGAVVDHAYSAQQVKDLIQQSVAAALQSEVAPIKQEFQTRQQRDAVAEQTRQLNAQVDSIYDSAVAEFPHFKEHEVEIAQAYDAIPGEGEAALYRAWAKVVLPKLDAKSKAAHLDSLQTKAAATTIKPGAAISATTRPRSFNDPSLKWS